MYLNIFREKSFAGHGELEIFTQLFKIQLLIISNSQKPQVIKIADCPDNSPTIVLIHDAEHFEPVIGAPEHIDFQTIKKYLGMLIFLLMEPI